MISASPSTPPRWPWPPMILTGSIAAGVAAGHLAPFSPPCATIASVSGLLLAATGLALDVGALLVLRSSRTTIPPNRSASALVTSGPFARSRNPIYVGNALLLLGLAGLLSNWWLVLAAAASLPLVRVLAIRPEERHLEARFGAEYLAYRDRVPRWVRI